MDVVEQVGRAVQLPWYVYWRDDRHTTLVATFAIDTDAQAYLEKANAWANTAREGGDLGVGYFFLEERPQYIVSVKNTEYVHYFVPADSPEHARSVFSEELPGRFTYHRIQADSEIVEITEVGEGG